MILSLGGIRQAAVGRTHGFVLVLSPRPPRDRGALHLLNGHHTGQRPKIAIGNPWELLYRIRSVLIQYQSGNFLLWALTFDGLEELAGDVQTRVGAVASFGLESHGCAVAASRARLLVVRARRVPCQA